MAVAGSQEIVLERDGHDQPWGFRLQGGSDVGMPLSIQRVLVGTPSEGVLRKGDVLVRISRTDAKGITHQQAADLFTNVGNQISILIKRPGATHSNSATAGPSIPPPQPVQIPTVSPARGSSDPYRTSPLIQPSAKADIGPGSTQHLRMQADFITGVKESIPAVDPRATEFCMKQKVTGTLQQIQLSSSPPDSKSPVPMQSLQQHQPLHHQPQTQVPAKQYYNNPVNLYSTENVAEVAKLNQMGVSGLAPTGTPGTSPSGLLHPNKPQVAFTPPTKDYNPKESATWLALQESDPTIDPEKLKNYSTLKEHDPIFSEVYAAPKLPLQNKSLSPKPAGPSKIPCRNPRSSQHKVNIIAAHMNNENAHILNPGRAPQTPPNTSIILQSPPIRSPVAEFLPGSIAAGGKTIEERGGLQRSRERTSSDPQYSAVLEAALAESKPLDSDSVVYDLAGLPLYETNSIGGRKRIAQSASFNRLMMNVLGE